MDQQDQAFLAAFCDLSLPPAQFNHLGHLRISWLFLQAHDFDTAVERVCSGIVAYATHLGAAAKFNRSVTVAFLHIMKSRGAADAKLGWVAFLAANPELVNDAKGVLATYYSPARLAETGGTPSFVAPDLAPLPA